MSEKSMIRNRVKAVAREFEFEQMRKYVRNVVDAEMKDWPFFYKESYPWHYHFFRRFMLYRRYFIGGTWQLFLIEELGREAWMRVKRKLDGAIITETWE